MATDISAAELGLVLGDLTKNQHAADMLQQQIAATATWYTLTLKPVQNGPFAKQYDLVTTNLQLPAQVNLAAPASP